MKKLISYGSLFVIAALFINACDLLEVEPAQSVSPEVVTENFESLEQLSQGVYAHMYRWGAYGNVMGLVPDLLADNGRLRPGASRHQSRTNNTASTAGHLSPMWQPYYEAINDINLVIKYLPEINLAEITEDESDRDRILGEMYFMRALLYHDLTKTFGYEPGMAPVDFDVSVILRTEPVEDVPGADFRGRAPVSEVYTQIESDLENARTLLAEHGRTGGSASFFGNYAAALGLSARVALFQAEGGANTAQLERARDFAQQAMDAAADVGAGLTSGGAVADMFAGNPNPEALFEISIQNQDESLGVNDALSPYLLPAQWHANVPAEDFVALFESNDARLPLYPFDEGNGYYYTIKYNQWNDVWTDNTPVIRYAEMMLIHAEAEAELNNEGDALNTLNELRVSRAASELDVSGSALIDAIMTERRLELAFEGHRWFDLKRRGMDVPKPAPTGQATLSYNDFRLLAPIADSQVELNEELVQSPGY